MYRRSKYCVVLSSAPPLTLDNILKALEGMKDWRRLPQRLGVFLSSGNSFRDVMERFLNGHGRYQPCWRAVIFALDGLGDTHLANHIKSYGGPIQGVCVRVK